MKFINTKTEEEVNVTSESGRIFLSSEKISFFIDSPEVIFKNDYLTIEGFVENKHDNDTYKQKYFKLKIKE
jgi:hypothetical protein